MDEIEKKLAAARTWLILDKPFLGALVMRLPLKQADARWCPTTATDARAFYYNRAYIEALSFEQTKFVLAHEALHCALGHFARRGHRDKRRWDLATDLAINPLLVAEGLTPPPNALVLDQFKDMTAEEIYPYLDENTEEEPMDRHLYDEGAPPAEASGDGSGGGRRDGPPPPSEEGEGGGQGGAESRGGVARQTGGQPERRVAGGEGGSGAEETAPLPPPPLGVAEREQLALAWQQRLAGAAQAARQAGKLGGSLARLIDHLLQPRLPWRMLLARYVSAAARDDYSFQRPSRRREGPAILPGLRSAHIDLVVALDTSGSISDAEMREFAAEIDAIKGQVGARIWLHACDNRLAEGGPWLFEPWEALTLPKTLVGGGGTSFRPVFEWVETLDRQPDLLVYFTDAEGEFPPREPPYPVLWLVKGKAPVPWGQRIQLN
jgi:predicted metal-dependent peptidase